MCWVRQVHDGKSLLREKNEMRPSKEVDEKRDG